MKLDSAPIAMPMTFKLSKTTDDGVSLEHGAVDVPVLLDDAEQLVASGGAPTPARGWPPTPARGWGSELHLSIVPRTAEQVAAPWEDLHDAATTDTCPLLLPTPGRRRVAKATLRTEESGHGNLHRWVSALIFLLTTQIVPACRRFARGCNLHLASHTW